jgi:hypothetical protein
MNLWSHHTMFLLFQVCEVQGRHSDFCQVFLQQSQQQNTPLIHSIELAGLFAKSESGKILERFLL